MQSLNRLVRVRGQTSEVVRAGIRQITKLCCRVDVVQTEGFGGWIMSGIPGCGFLDI